MWRWSKLSTKLMLVMSGVTGIGVLGVALAFIINVLTLQEARLNDRIETEMELLAQNIGPAVLFNDRTAASEMLAALSIDPAIQQALLRGRDGEPFAEYRAPDAQGEGDFLSFNQEIRIDAELVGLLELNVSRHELVEEGGELFLFASVVLLLVSLVVILVAWRAQRLIAVPVVRLNRLARQVGETRDYRLRATVHSNDEIGELAQQFNLMLENIQSRDVMLEKQVRQRTEELEKLAEEFRHRAFHDSLTGLPNRALLNEYFATAVSHALRYRSRFALMLLDLDKFKELNDSLGHQAGDQLLRDVATRLRNAVREEDMVVRLGGDEFVILAEDIREPSMSEVIADNIVHELAREFQIEGRHWRVTVSIGISLYPDHGQDLSELKQNADVAMYAAKAAGRNGYCRFERARAIPDFKEQR